MHIIPWDWKCNYTKKKSILKDIKICILYLEPGWNGLVIEWRKHADTDV